MRILLVGALGEVGRSLRASLHARGHDVIGTTSRTSASGTGAIPIAAGIALIDTADVDLVVNCSGPGDRRGMHDAPAPWTDELLAALRRTGIRGVLISTTRVLEGVTGEVFDDTHAQAVTPYARANATRESLWLEDAVQTSVCRVTNYFAMPSSADSPQCGLLPWSLLVEALQTGRVGIRSGPSLRKAFVSAADLATAIETVSAAAAPPRICATTPGLVTSMRDLATACAEALVATGRSAPEVTFGEDASLGLDREHAGWLSANGWHASLTLAEMADVMSSWVTGVWEPQFGSSERLPGPPES